MSGRPMLSRRPNINSLSTTTRRRKTAVKIKRKKIDGKYIHPPIHIIHTHTKCNQSNSKRHVRIRMTPVLRTRSTSYMYNVSKRRSSQNIQKEYILYKRNTTKKILFSGLSVIRVEIIVVVVLRNTSIYF